MPEERKLATVLFADIVGSTAAGGAHDPEVVRRTLGRAFAEMRQILETHGGTVEKFIGDAVMAVFGVPAAHDDDADRAIRAAFALRARVSELNATGRIPLQLRIGVNTGQVVAGTGGETLVTGPAVNEAARLQQTAAPDEILAGALTRRLAAGGVSYAEPRTVRAKGVGDLVGHPAVALTSDLPEQHRGLAGLRSPLVGRDDELRLLVDSYRKTASERRAFLLTVFGSPGVGKSRLVREFVQVIGDARVRRGRCLPYGEGITFWPVAEILRQDAEISAADARDGALTKLRQAVLATLGASDDADAVARRLAVLAGLSSPEEAVPDVSAERLQQELRTGLRRYVERRADPSLVLVFDDIHWAEPPLLDLIEHLAEWSRTPLFLLCMARPELRDQRRGWGGGLMNAAAIALEPLTVEESRRLVSALLDIDALPERLRAQVIERSEGNPLYLEEFLRMLIDGGHIALSDGRWVARDSVADLVVPPSLQGLIAARLDQSPAEMKALLQRAAVMGKVFWTDAVAALGDGADPQDVLLDAARRDIVLELDERSPRGGAAYQFKHILIRDVAYEGIPKEQRVTLHDGFGRWLESAAAERLDEYADIVAYHAEQAFRYADELGEPETVEMGRRALDLLLAAGRKAWRRSDFRAVRSFYDRAAAVADRASCATAAELAEARLLATVAKASIETTAESISELRRAVEEARAAGPTAALADGMLWLSYLVITSSDAGYDEAVALLDEAAAVARTVGDHELVARAMLNRSGPEWWRGDLVRHRARLEETLVYAREHDARSELPQILGWLGANAWVRGELTLGRSLHAEFSALAQRTGSLEDERLAKQSEAHLDTAEDRPLDAARTAREARVLAEQGGSREWVSRAYEQIGDALYWAGDHAGSRDALEEALRWLDPATMRGSLPEIQWKLSRAYRALGDLVSARAQAEAGRASVIAGDVFSMATTATALAQVEAASGAYDEAERLFREALERARGTGYVAMTAETEIAYAAFLIDRGRVAEARELLAAAAEKSRDPLARLARRRIDEQLRRCAEVAAGS